MVEALAERRRRDLLLRPLIVHWIGGYRQRLQTTRSVLPRQRYLDRSVEARHRHPLEERSYSAVDVRMNGEAPRAIVLGPREVVVGS